MLPGSNQPNPEVAVLDDHFWGVDMRDPRTLPPGMLNDGENLRYTNLLPQTRKGVIKPAWANRIDVATSAKIRPWGVIYGTETFRDPDSRDWEIMAADGFIWRLLPNNQATSVPLPTGVKILGTCTFTQAFDRVYCFRGRSLAPLRLQNFDDGFEDILPQWTDASPMPATTEVAYGPTIAVTSVTRLNDLVTVVTAAAHDFISGADVTLYGANQSAYNVRANITVVDDVTFQYSIASVPVTPATGTIRCSNNAFYWKALGSLVTLTTLTRIATTATATKTAHGFSNGDTVTIAGASPAGYNITAVISGVTANTFQYTLAADPGADATGTITARNNLVLAGQSPESNPEAWKRLYNVLPNADNALYINNRLLVPTALEPSSIDSYQTFNGGAYKKKDYIVATDYLDDIHFDFSDEFRINQGSSDEIVDLAKFNENTAIVWKGTSWGVLGNIALDLSQLTLDMRSSEYGLCAIGAWAMAGQDMLFVADKRGVVSIQQTQFSKFIGVDLPLSAPIERLIARINWSAAASIRMANFNSHLYVGVPLDGSATNNAILVYDFIAASRGNSDVYFHFGWCGPDTGTAITPKLFFKLKVDNVDRLLFAAEDGYVNLMEESDAGDQVADATAVTGLGLEEIKTRQVSRAYLASASGLMRPTTVAVAMQTYNPQFSVEVLFSGVNKKTVVATDKTRDRTRYFRPWDAKPWDSTNVNDDHETPDREDYSVLIPDAGLHLGSGLVLNSFQETLQTFKVAGRQGRSFQVAISNTRGRMRLLDIRLGAVRGRNRKGTLV